MQTFIIFVHNLNRKFLVLKVSCRMNLFFDINITPQSSLPEFIVSELFNIFVRLIVLYLMRGIFSDLNFMLKSNILPLTIIFMPTYS